MHKNIPKVISEQSFLGKVVVILIGLLFFGVFCGLILKTLSKPLISSLLILCFIITTFFYRFQRVTLGISRDIIGIGDQNFQLILTPNWLKSFTWTIPLLWLIISVILFFQFRWSFAVVFLLYVFIGTSSVDFIVFFPSYNQCFKIIENSLNKDIKKTLNPAEKEKLEILLNEIKKIENRKLK